MEIVISGINNGFKDITLIDGNVRLIMSIYGNGDLYWTITDDSKLIKNMFFTITRENGAVYSAFQDLFADIENVNVLAIPEKINAKVNIRKSNKLEIGDNVVEIIVTAEDNITKKKYIVTVHRRNNEEEEKTEEHREVQAEKLSTILQQNNNINDNSGEIREETNNKTPINEEKRNKNENIYVYISAGIVIAIIIIFILYKKRKNK